MDSLESTLSQASNRITNLKQRLFHALERCVCPSLCGFCEGDIRFLCEESGEDPNEAIARLRKGKAHVSVEK